MRQKKRRATAVALLSTIVAGCGGGGGSDAGPTAVAGVNQTAPAPSPAPSASPPPASQAGSGTFSATDVRVLRGDAVAAGAVSGQFVARQSFGGVIAGAEASGLQFALNYSSSYLTPAQNASIAGAWSATLPGGTRCT